MKIKETGFTSQSALGKIRQIHGDFIHLVHLITLVCFTSMMITDLGFKNAEKRESSFCFHVTVPILCTNLAIILYI